MSRARPEAARRWMSRLYAFLQMAPSHALLQRQHALMRERRRATAAAQQQASLGTTQSAARPPMGRRAPPRGRRLTRGALRASAEIPTLQHPGVGIEQPLLQRQHSPPQLSHSGATARRCSPRCGPPAPAFPYRARARRALGSCHRRHVRSWSVPGRENGCWPCAGHISCHTQAEEQRR